jgi:hypothetical protein
MAWTITKSDMDTYFLPNNHVKAYTYRKYNDDEKNAAFNQAVRELKVSQGRELVDPASTDVYRDDYGTFEQALFILENTPRQLAEGVPQVIDLVKPKENENLERVGVLISPQALRYFAINRIKMVRG